MGSNNYVRILTVQCELREGGFWVFTSKNLPGFLLSGKHYATLMEDVPRAVSALYRLNYDLNVDVRPAV